MVPALGRARNRDAAVVADEHREGDVLAEQAAQRPRHVRLQQYVLDEPILEEDCGRLVCLADARHVVLSHAVGDEGGVGDGLALEPLAGALVDVLRDDAREQQAARAAELQDLRGEVGWGGKVGWGVEEPRERGGGRPPACR